MKLNLEGVPQLPGVYIWKDKLNNVIYVGKAKKLNSRMKQYFKGMLNSYKTAILVKRIAGFEYIITNSEKEALVLERNLISKYLPPFNIRLLDDKRYPYIKVQLKKKLDVSLIYRISKASKNTIYYGPFPNGYGARKLTNLIQKLTMYEKGLPSNEVSKEYWGEKFEYARTLLNSKNSSFILQLKKRMNEYADNQQYEIAAQIKDAISVFDSLKESQVVQIKNQEDFDVIGAIEKNGFLSIAMLFYRSGIMLSKKEKLIEITSDPEDSLRQFVSQYYAINFVPKQIVTNKKISTDIKTLIPQKGNIKNVLKIAISNANDNIENKLKEYELKSKRSSLVIKELSTLLKIDNLHRIIMIDNSNTNNTLPISGIISYVNGVKQPLEYRKYNLEVIDNRKADVEYMKQGLTKFFKNNETITPNLLIVDGGKQQINEAKKIVPSSIRIIGLVKNDKHKTDKVIDESGNEILPISRDLFNFLSRMQIEVDLYAKRHHASRRKTTMEGKLTTINGIGPSIEKKLLNHFKTYSAIYNASENDLSKVISKTLAKKIKEEL